MMQPEKLKVLLEEIGKAIQNVLRQWPELKCDGCGAMQEYEVTQVILETPYMNPQAGWRINGINFGKNAGWIRLSGDGFSTKSYCPSCAKERIL